MQRLAPLRLGVILQGSHMLTSLVVKLNLILIERYFAVGPSLLCDVEYGLLSANEALPACSGEVGL